MYAKWFQEKGYSVERIPIYEKKNQLLNGTTFWSFNNGLVEVYEENGQLKKYYYMPVYGASCLEQYCVEVLNTKGYYVIPTRMFAGTIASGGSLHCITNESR